MPRLHVNLPAGARDVEVRDVVADGVDEVAHDAREEVAERVLVFGQNAEDRRLHGMDGIIEAGARPSPGLRPASPRSRGGGAFVVHPPTSRGGKFAPSS